MWSISAFSLPSGVWKYQDQYIDEPLAYGHMVGVFDGHGEMNDAVTIARVEIRTYLRDRTDEISLEALPEAFRRAADATHVCVGGSTAAVACLSNDGEAKIAILGDSLIVARRSTESLYSSTHHNVRTNMRERANVERRGGVYHDCYARKTPGGVGLQSGRAFGDFELHPVIGKNPDIDRIFIKSGGWLLACTDGVLDPASGSFSKYRKRIVEMIDGGATAEELVFRCTENKRHKDDATAVICRFS